MKTLALSLVALFAITGSALADASENPTRMSQQDSQAIGAFVEGRSAMVTTVDQDTIVRASIEAARAPVRLPVERVNLGSNDAGND